MKSIIVAVPQSDAADEYKTYSPLLYEMKCFLQRYGMISMLITILFLGLIMGAVRIGMTSSDAMSRVNDFILKLLSYETSQTPAAAFIRSFVFSFVFIALLYLISISPTGLFFIPAVLFFRGFSYGIVSAVLCVSFGLKGLAYYISVILPGAFLSSMALLYFAQYCMDFSVSVLFLIFGKSAENNSGLRSKFGEMTLNCTYMIIVTVFASLIDNVLFHLVGKIYNFN